MLEMFDAVRLKVDIPEYGLSRGAVGTVVEIWGDPASAYELDFNGYEGYTGPTTFALATDQVEPIS